MAASLLGCLLFPAVSGMAAVATDTVADPANPYFVISERNVFHLNPIPPPPEPEKPKQDLPVIKISGFVKVGNSSKALFSSTSKDKKDLPIYYSLSEGEKQGFLELVKIDRDKGEAEIINSGVKMTLNLKDDTLKDTISAPPAGGPMQARFDNRRGLPPIPGVGRAGAPARVNVPYAGPTGARSTGPNPFNFPMRTRRGQ
ncbi:MAG TPA: hypothetical protein VFC44_13035 [Candidatus Saccharimonadales bacterium]|nr:hypothetical protein [Candidatus Saccharimonadales bacterium]